MSTDLRSKIESFVEAMAKDDEVAAKALFIELVVKALTDLGTIAQSLQRIADAAGDALE